MNVVTEKMRTICVCAKAWHIDNRETFLTTSFNTIKYLSKIIKNRKLSTCQVKTRNLDVNLKTMDCLLDQLTQEKKYMHTELKMPKSCFFEDNHITG